MKPLISKEPIWHEKSDAILALSGSSIRLKYPNGIERETRVLIQRSPTSDRKIGVTVWMLGEPSDRPFRSVTEHQSEQIEDMHQITLFFTATAVEMLLSRIASDPASELSLDL
jgi:hypothetical protein